MRNGFTQGRKESISVTVANDWQHPRKSPGKSMRFKPHQKLSRTETGEVGPDTNRCMRSSTSTFALWAPAI